MILWSILLTVMTLAAVPISLANWWLVFGLWPKSWLWFIFFAFVGYGQQELTKYIVKRLIQAQQEEM
jgi:hypothetical protein